jgi:AraC-like DNA-binding protein
VASVQLSISLVRALISVIEASGASRDEFLARAGIDPDLVEQGQARLSVKDYRRAIDAALEVTGEPALGLRLGEHASAAMYPVVAHVVEQASTLGGGIEMMTRYSALLAAGYEPRLIDTGPTVSLRLSYLADGSAATRLTAEFLMTALSRMLRQYVGPNAHPHRVSFVYRAPAHAAEYRRVFRGVECFEQPFTELEFPREWLARSQLHSNPGLHNVLRMHAERELCQLERGATIVEQVQSALASRDPRSSPTMTELARELDVSARTLARKLQIENATYTELVERWRQGAAKSLLEDRRLTIQETAAAMGFASAPAFHRAFRRWTGQTPKQYISSIGR